MAVEIFPAQRHAEFASSASSSLGCGPPEGTAEGRTSQAEGRTLRRCTTTRLFAAVAAILLIHAGLLAFSATQHSPTLDEPGHLVAGLSQFEFGHFELYRVNTPLVHTLAAIPVLLAGYESDWSPYTIGGSRPIFNLGDAFVRANGERTLWLMTLARWACLPISLAGAVVCFLWSRELWASNSAALLSLSLWCFEPNLLAHGELITADAAATAMGLLACFTFWRWQVAPSRGRAAFAGVCLGIALLSKLTWILLLPSYVFIWAATVIAFGKRRRSGVPFGRQAVQVAGILILGVYVLNLGYLFQGSLTKLGDFPFKSPALCASSDRPDDANRFTGTVWGELRIPLPYEYVRGLDVQNNDFRRSVSLSYLGGEWRHPGWWYYYLYAAGVKTTHCFQFLLLAAVVACAASGISGRQRLGLMTILGVAGVVFCTVSANFEFSQNWRYALPCLGFACVLAGRAALFAPRAWGCVVVLALMGHAASSLANYPHSLAFFNELSGGASNGSRHLLHSSLDWGQDLPFLSRWMHDNPEARPFFYHSDCSVRPEWVGIPVDRPANSMAVEAWKSLGDGWHAVTMTLFRRWEYDGFNCESQGVQTVGTIGRSVVVLRKQADARGTPKSRSTREYEFDLGEVVAGNLARHEFEFVNTLKTPLDRAQDMPRSCGCTQATVDWDILSPGESASVAMSVDTSAKSGPFRESVKVQWLSRQGESIETVFILYGTVVTALNAEPSNVVMFSVEDVKRADTKVVRLWSDLDLDWAALRVMPTQTPVSCRIGAVVDSSGRELVFSIDAEKLDGPIDREIRVSVPLAASNEETRRQDASGTIRVLCEAPRRVRVVPATVRLTHAATTGRLMGTCMLVGVDQLVETEVRVQCEGALTKLDRILRLSESVRRLEFSLDADVAAKGSLSLSVFEGSRVLGTVELQVPTNPSVVEGKE